MPVTHHLLEDEDDRTTCWISLAAYPSILRTPHRDAVSCKRCLDRLARRDGALVGVYGWGQRAREPEHKLRSVNERLATKADIADLRRAIDNLAVELRSLLSERSTDTEPPLTSRYMGAAECAAYLGRSEKAIRHMVDRIQIPYAKIGRRLMFDRDKIAKWLERHGRRAIGTR
jgi:excisionase family DNA binding protein